MPFINCRCPLCGWPMCAEACTAAASHQAECALTRARGSPINIEIKNSAKPFPLYEAVAILRCMSLKTTGPDKYKALFELEGHIEERKRTGRLDKDKATMLRVLRHFFQISATDFSDDEILHICGILFVNGHEIPVTNTPCQAIYCSASLVEHSCVNNASKHFDMNCNIQVKVQLYERSEIQFFFRLRQGTEKLCMICLQFYSIHESTSDCYATFLCFEKLRKKGKMTVFNAVKKKCNLLVSSIDRFVASEAHRRGHSHGCNHCWSFSKYQFSWF